jgi:hypothetical protein
MARHILSEDEAMTRIDGRYNDGDRHVLIVRNNGCSAIHFFEYNGTPVGERNSDRVSIGARKKTSLNQARTNADFCRGLLAKGISPKRWREQKRKETQRQEAASLTLAEAIEGRADPEFEGFRKWGTRRKWHKPSSLAGVSWVIRGYLQPSPIWNMRVQDVEVEHAIQLLDPIWFPKQTTGKRVQSFCLSLFKWLKLKKLYFGENPFYGGRDGPLVEGLGGPQPPGGHLKDPEPDDLPIVMAHLRTPPTHGDDVCTVAELAEAAETTPDAIRKMAKRGFFGEVERWADWGTATYLIQIKEVMNRRDVLPLKRPLRKHIEIPIESLAIQLVTLTAARPGMVCALEWDWIKDKRGFIEYPKYDHKTGLKVNDVYTVIITPAVQEVLDAARAYQQHHGIKSDYVFVKGGTRTGINAFSGQRVKKATLWSQFRVLLARLPGIEKPDATIGGVRTSFITWAVDRNDCSPEVADVALGHVLKGISNRSYFRNVRYFRQNQEWATKWGNFLHQIAPDSVEVIPIRSQPQLLNDKGKRYA